MKYSDRNYLLALTVNPVNKQWVIHFTYKEERKQEYLNDPDTVCVAIKRSHKRAPCSPEAFLEYISKAHYSSPIQDVVDPINQHFSKCGIPLIPKKTKYERYRGSPDGKRRKKPRKLNPDASKRCVAQKYSYLIGIKILRAPSGTPEDWDVIRVRESCSSKPPADTLVVPLRNHEGNKCPLNKVGLLSYVRRSQATADIRRICKPIAEFVVRYGLQKPLFSHLPNMNNTGPRKGIIAQPKCLIATAYAAEMPSLPGEAISAKAAEGGSLRLRVVNPYDIGIDHEDAAAKWLREHNC